MTLSASDRNSTTRLRCWRRRLATVAQRKAPSDWQLHDIGLWRGVIPAVAAEIPSAQGCPAPARRPGWRADFEPTIDQAT